MTTELEDLRRIGLFAGTDDDQLRELAAAGTEVRFRPGDVLFAENAPAEHWWVLLEGAVDLVRHVGRDETRLGAMDVPGRWAGGFRAWDEHGAYLATGRATSTGCVLRVPAEALLAVWTARFPLGLSLIEGVSRSARNYETMARQREALAALGTLAAGLAHELNNPAAAATRAVDALGDAFAGMLSALRRLAAAPVTAEQFAGLDALRAELGPRPPESVLEVADREDRVAEWLADHDVQRDWEVGPTLAAAGADVEWCERAAEAVGTSRLDPGLDWIAGTLSAGVLLEEVKESTRRISDLVAAVKSYSQLDRAAMQETDVAEGLDSTLVMLGHRIPPEVTVVRDHGRRRPPDHRDRGRAEPGLDQRGRQRPRRHGRPRHAACLDAARARRGGGRDRRHRRRADRGGPAARLRALLHHQGGRRGHRPRPRHLAAHRRPAPRGHRPGGAAGRDGAARAAPDRTRGGDPGPICWLTPRMVSPLPEPGREIDPDQPVPDDPAELLPDAPEPLPPPPIEATPDDPGGDPGGVPEPA